MNPLSNEINYFDLLPASSVGHVLDQLNLVTGSKGIVNKADISVIMRYTCNLACTSKSMAAKVSDLEATLLFLQSLSNKYGQSDEHFAALLNTVGTRKWMWDNIKTKGYDQVYQVIQDIYELASDVLKEAKDAGLSFEFSEGRKGWPSPNPFYYQTDQGFVLYNDSGPNKIATPFGEIKIYGGGGYSGHSTYSASEIFIKRLNAVFESVAYGSKFDKEPGKIFEIIASGSDIIRKISAEEMKQISEEELKSKEGTQNLIVNSLGGRFSSYNIREVKGKRVPEVIWNKSSEPTRSYEFINLIWKMLETNRLGRDPIAKKIKYDEVRTSKVSEPLFKNISEASQWGIELAEKLEQQTIFPEKSWMSCETKVLILDRFRDADTLQILNSAAVQFLDKKSEWLIHTFGCSNNRRSLNGKDLGEGLELWIYEKRTSCDINTLKIAYDSVIRNISQGWIKSKLKDYPGILFTKSEEDYALFVKKENYMKEEGGLLNCLAGQLGLSDSISCYGDWKVKESSSGLYFWVSKVNLERTLEALNIGLT